MSVCLLDTTMPQSARYLQQPCTGRARAGPCSGCADTASITMRCCPGPRPYAAWWLSSAACSAGRAAAMLLVLMPPSAQQMHHASCLPIHSLHLVSHKQRPACSLCSVVHPALHSTVLSAGSSMLHQCQSQPEPARRIGACMSSNGPVSGALHAEACSAMIQHKQLNRGWSAERLPQSWWNDEAPLICMIPSRHC